MINKEKIKKILANYEHENAGTKTNLYRLLMQGTLGGTGKLLILPVDQGFEHGPDKSFAANPESYNPKYHFNLAIEARLSAYAAPLGMLSMGCDEFAGQIPLILKLNSNNSLETDLSQALTASVKDAVLMGCVGIGYTIYPGSKSFKESVSILKDLIREAKSYGLFVVVWSYPRGGDISKEGESAIDVIGYGVHIAALLGANIIKVKPPTDFIEKEENKQIYLEHNIDTSTLEARIKHVMKCCFNNKRLVLFSGGLAKSVDEIAREVLAIHKGGGSGSIMGRNSFTRPKEDALKLLAHISNIYSS